MRQRPDGDHRAAGDAEAEHQRGAQPQRGERKPAAARDDRGDQCSARVRQHHDRGQDRQRRHAQRAQDPPGGRPRAGPHARRQAHRGHQPGGVPVVERRPQARHRVVGVQRSREHLDDERPGADHRRRGRERAEQRRPASGAAAPARGGGERGQVGDLRLASTQELSGCTDQAIEANVSAASVANSSSVTPPQARPGAPITITAAARRRGQQRRGDLHPRVRTKVGAAGGHECDQHEQRGEAASESRVGSDGGPTSGTVPLASSGPDAARLGAGAIDDTARERISRLRRSTGVHGARSASGCARTTRRAAWIRVCPAAAATLHRRRQPPPGIGDRVQLGTQADGPRLGQQAAGATAGCRRGCRAPPPRPPPGWPARGPAPTGMPQPRLDRHQRAAGREQPRGLGEAWSAAGPGTRGDVAPAGRAPPETIRGEGCPACPASPHGPCRPGPWRSPRDLLGIGVDRDKVPLRAGKQVSPGMPAGAIETTRPPGATGARSARARDPSSGGSGPRASSRG